MTAGMYAARHGLRTGIIERMMGGASIINVEKVENFPGFSEGIMGADLAAMTQEQAMTSGAEFVMGEVSGISTSGDYRIVSADSGDLQAKTVIVAAGSTLRLLGIPGEDEFTGRGVSQCATCDGPLYSGEVVGVVGGGDSATDEALVLAQYADRVLLFHRRDELRAQRELVDRVLAEPKIEVVWSTVIEEVLGENTVSGVSTTNMATGEKGARELSGLFRIRRAGTQRKHCGRSVGNRRRRPHPGEHINGDGPARRLRGRRHPPTLLIAVGIRRGRRRNRSHRCVPLYFRKSPGTNIESGNSKPRPVAAIHLQGRAKMASRIHRPRRRAAPEQQDHRRGRSVQQPRQGQPQSRQLPAEPGLPHYPGQSGDRRGPWGEKLPRPQIRPRIHRHGRRLPPLRPSNARGRRGHRGRRQKYIWMQDGVINEDAKAKAEAAGIPVIMNDCALRQHRRRFSRG